MLLVFGESGVVLENITDGGTGEGGSDEEEDEEEHGAEEGEKHEHHEGHHHPGIHLRDSDEQHHRTEDFQGKDRNLKKPK